MDGFVNRMAEAHKKEMDEIIKKKIEVLSQKALIRGEDVLHDILKEIDVRNLEKTKNKLSRFGYSLELEQPQPIYSMEDGNFKATLPDIKLKVTKLILEA